MIWIGTTTLSEQDVKFAPIQGSLCKDWACAMPPRFPGSPGPATSIFRSSASDYALAIAQRLGTFVLFSRFDLFCRMRVMTPIIFFVVHFLSIAQRFKKQIFLSVDIPSSVISLGQGPQLLLRVEKAALDTLKAAEEANQGARSTTD
jgi:proteasome assembly chaperone 4